MHKITNLHCPVYRQIYIFEVIRINIWAMICISTAINALSNLQSFNHDVLHVHITVYQTVKNICVIKRFVRSIFLVKINSNFWFICIPVLCVWIINGYFLQKFVTHLFYCLFGISVTVLKLYLFVLFFFFSFISHKFTFVITEYR